MYIYTGRILEANNWNNVSLSWFTTAFLVSLHLSNSLVRSVFSLEEAMPKWCTPAILAKEMSSESVSYRINCCLSSRRLMRLFRIRAAPFYESSSFRFTYSAAFFNLALESCKMCSFVLKSRTSLISLKSGCTISIKFELVLSNPYTLILEGVILLAKSS